MDKYYMEMALNQANKALINGDVPVGAIIVKNNKIISRGYNQKELGNNSTYHAEIIAIQKACKKLNNWRLDGCTLYVTMEPCMMCCGAILQSRIPKVVYGTSNCNFGYIKHLNNIEVISNICEIDCKKLVQTFFKKRR